MSSRLTTGARCSEFPGTRRRTMADRRQEAFRRKWASWSTSSKAWSSAARSAPHSAGARLQHLRLWSLRRRARLRAASTRCLRARWRRATAGDESCPWAPTSLAASSRRRSATGSHTAGPSRPCSPGGPAAWPSRAVTRRATPSPPPPPPPLPPPQPPRPTRRTGSCCVSRRPWETARSTGSSWRCSATHPRLQPLALEAACCTADYTACCTACCTACTACAQHVRCMCAACALQVMMGFQSGILDTAEVMEHVSALLQGHWSLLHHFNESVCAVKRLPRSGSGRAGHLRFQAPTRLLRGALGPREEPLLLGHRTEACGGLPSQSC